MLISIVIPIYNVAEYLCECIDSILSQSYKNIEIILVDDGSKDNSLRICEEYASKYNIIKVIHKKNEGVSVARNHGISTASGDYLMFLDGDDYWEEDFLQVLVNSIKGQNFPDFIFGNSYYQVSDSKKKLVTCEFLDSKFNILRNKKILEYILTNTSENPWSVWRNIYKTDIIKSKNILFQKGKTFGEDADWLFRVLLNIESCSLFQLPFYMYRINRQGSAMTTITSESLNSYLDIIIQWIKYHEENKDNISGIICEKLCNNYIQLLKFIYSHEEDVINEVISKIQAVPIFMYATSTYGIKVDYMNRKIGLKNTLKYLNILYRIRQSLKRLKIIMKL